MKINTVWLKFQYQFCYVSETVDSIQFRNHLFRNYEKEPNS